MNIEDGLVFTEDEYKVIFNHYSFCELVKWVIVKYAHKEYSEADKLVQNSFLHDVPESYSDVTLITHELEFHWAMLLAHGNMYWLKGIPSDYNEFKEDYSVWEKCIIETYNLKKSYEYLHV